MPRSMILIALGGRGAGVGMGVGMPTPMGAGVGVGVVVAMENKVAVATGVRPQQLATTMQAISRVTNHILFTADAILPWDFTM